MSRAKVDTLVLGADNLDVDERNSVLTVDPTHDSNAHLQIHGVGQGIIDQSGSRIHVEGAEGKSSILNRIDGCGDIHVNQDRTFSVVEASGNSGITAVNYITNTTNYEQSVNDSVIIVDGRKRTGGITAHTVVGENANYSITLNNTTTIIMG